MPYVDKVFDGMSSYKQTNKHETHLRLDIKNAASSGLRYIAHGLLTGAVQVA